MALSDEISIARKKGLCTQNEFANLVGVSYSTVNRWETGKMNPNVSAMKRIKAYCEKFGIDFGDIERAWLEKTSESEQKKENA